MEEWQVPGLALAVTREGEADRIETYGLRDVEAGLPVTFGDRQLVAGFDVIEGACDFGTNATIKSRPRVSCFVSTAAQPERGPVVTCTEEYFFVFRPLHITIS